MTPGSQKQPVSWTGYLYAVLAFAGIVALRWETNHLTGELISMPLCGLAVVIFATRLGTGPGILAAAITTIWCGYESWSPSLGIADWFRCSVYALEASLACVFARQLRIAREEAATGEAWHRQVVETSGEGIWMVNPDGTIAYANPRIAEILGCTVPDLTGRRVEDYFFPEDQASERIRFQTRRPGVRDQFDRRLKRADGREVWTLACSSPYSRGGKDAGVLTMMTDITERKKAEHSLRSSERKFRELFENIREGVYQTAPDGRIMAANPELLRMLGFSTPEELNVPGVVRDTFVDPSVHVSLRDKLERDGSYANIEFQLRTRDKRIITVRENARVVRDDNGNVAYYEGTLTDLTDSMRIEKYLRQVREMEALSRLAGGVGRDLVQIVQRLRTSDRDSGALAKSIEDAERLCSQILEFSHRSMAVTDAVIDINGFVREYEPELRRYLRPGATLALSLGERLMPALADAGYLQQIAVGFMIHAGQFHPDRIEVVTSIEEPGPAGTTGPYICLSVRAPLADSSAEATPWVGAETIQAIIARSGGIVRAVVEPPTATAGAELRCELYLPLEAGAGLAQPQADVADSIAAHGDVPGVLLLDEEPLLRELSRDMLERQGFRVLAAASVTEAERIARGPMPFEALITTSAANHLAGKEFVAHFRDIRPGARVLFIAGYSEAAPDASALPEGCSVITKPFSGNTLGRELRLLLEMAKARNANQ